MRVVISGYGKMGRMVELVLLRRGIELAMATEDVVSVPDEVAAQAVCIDFTTPAAFRANYQELARKFKAVVVGTTGWYDIAGEVFEAFKKENTTLIWASNFSIGVNAFFAALEKTAAVLKDQGYNCLIDETHHIHKLDAPSGTAKTAANIVEAQWGTTPEIESHRIGEVPGTHIATFSSEVDKLSLTHEAYSRQGFAEGAVTAAIMSESLSGIYEFKDIILPK